MPEIARSARCIRLGVVFRMLVASTAICWTGCAAAEPAPIRIAVFAFELEDFSAARPEGSAPREAAFLTEATEEARQQLLASGRYGVVDTAGADLSAAKGQGLRNCGGCEAPIARALGAQQALIGVVTKISMTEYIVRFRISDAQSGQAIANLSTDLRMGADYSWSRGVRWLMQNRMLNAK